LDEYDNIRDSLLQEMPGTTVVFMTIVLHESQSKHDRLRGGQDFYRAFCRAG
jgi:hypothetical protein